MTVLLQIILDQERLNKFFEDLSKGFEKSPFEIGLAIAMFAGMIVIPIILTIIFSVRSYAKAVKDARALLEKKAEEKQLTVEERAALARLTKYFSRNKRYLARLATDPPSFNAAARKCLKKKPKMDDMIARLRLKLGIAAKSSGQNIHSTAELMIGTPVFIHRPGSKPERGQVAVVDPGGIVIKTPSSPGENSTVMIEVRTAHGCFIISTRVIKTQGTAFLAAHTEKINHIQKRKFYRRKVKIPILVEIEGSGEEPEGGYMTDVSAGGARIYAPGLHFRINEPLKLRFSPDRRSAIKVNARALRLHEKDKTISVAFLDLAKAAEDRIMRVVLR